MELLAPLVELGLRHVAVVEGLLLLGVGPAAEVALAEQGLEVVGHELAEPVALEVEIGLVPLPVPLVGRVRVHVVVHRTPVERQHQVAADRDVPALEHLHKVAHRAVVHAKVYIIRGGEVLAVGGDELRGAEDYAVPDLLRVVAAGYLEVVEPEKAALLDKARGRERYVGEQNYEEDRGDKAAPLEETRKFHTAHPLTSSRNRAGRSPTAWSRECRI